MAKNTSSQLATSADVSPAPRAYRVNDFCKAFGVCRATAYALMSSGELPSVRIRGRRLIPVDGAEALLVERLVRADRGSN